MFGAGIGTRSMSSLRIFVLLGRALRNMSGTVPGPRNASFFPFRSSRVLIGESCITMIRSTGWLGVLKALRKGAIDGMPRVSAMMLGATPISPTTRLPAVIACRIGAKLLKRVNSTVSPSSLKKSTSPKYDWTAGLMGIVPSTIFSGTCAEANNPKLLADTDTVRSAVAVFSMWRRVGWHDLIFTSLGRQFYPYDRVPILLLPSIRYTLGF